MTIKKSKITRSFLESLSQKDRYRALTSDADAATKANYIAWINKNHEVWEEFKKLAEEQFPACERFSAWPIVAVLRFNRNIKVHRESKAKIKGEGFKIPNAYIGMLARQLISTDTKFFDFFEIRRMGGRSQEDEGEE